MHAISLKKSSFLAFGIPISILLVSVVLMLSPLVVQYPEIAMGITYDLTLFAPIVYLILIWKKPIPKITALPFFVVGTILGTFLLPEHQQTHLEGIKAYVLPIVELGVVGFIVYNVTKAIKSFNAHADEHTGDSDFYEIVQKASLDVLEIPKVAKVFSTEISMMYYSFVFWKKPKITSSQFSNYKKSGVVPLLLTIILVIAVETIALHFLLIGWNAVVTWILTLSSIYGGLQILGHTQALRLRPHTISKGKLYLKYGLFGDVEIDYNNIERIELSSKNITDESLQVEKLALLKDFEMHNVIIRFKEKQEIKKMYGIVKSANVLQFYVDDKEEFKKEIEKHLSISL